MRQLDANPNVVAVVIGNREVLLMTQRPSSDLIQRGLDWLSEQEEARAYDERAVGPLARLGEEEIYGRLTPEQHRRINPGFWVTLARIQTRIIREGRYIPHDQEETGE